MAERTYYRSRDGKTIHRGGCKRIAKTAVHWKYADGFSADALVTALALHPWLYPCRVCRPDAPPVSDGSAAP